MNSVARDHSDSEILHAFISTYRGVDQDSVTHVPTKRYVDIVVVTKPAGNNNECLWLEYRFSQKHAGGGTYSGQLKREFLQDRGLIDCETGKPSAATN